MIPVGGKEVETDQNIEASIREDKRYIGLLVNINRVCPWAMKVCSAWYAIEICQQQSTITPLTVRTKSYTLVENEIYDDDDPQVGDDCRRTNTGLRNSYSSGLVVGTIADATPGQEFSTRLPLEYGNPSEDDGACDEICFIKQQKKIYSTPGINGRYCMPVGDYLVVRRLWHTIVITNYDYFCHKQVACFT